MQQIDPCLDIVLPLQDRKVGKVRVSYALANNTRLFVTTDRLSAFDQIVASVPYKGQVLNQLAAWWFANTRDIIDNHVISLPDPNATVAVSATPLLVEVIVRGVMTGSTSTSIWKLYEQGKRNIYGYDFVDGIKKNTLLPEAIITPTTKGDAGTHDEPLTCADVVTRGLVDQTTWTTVCDAALALFARGQEVAKKQVYCSPTPSMNLVFIPMAECSSSMRCIRPTLRVFGNSNHTKNDCKRAKNPRVLIKNLFAWR